MMTESEIRQLEAGPVADALVARARGWVAHHRNTAHWHRAGDDGCDYRIMGETCGNDRYAPSTDPAAALELLDTPGTGIVRYGLSCNLDALVGYKRCRAVAWADEHETVELASVLAPTLALACVRLFLLVKLPVIPNPSTADI